jgi:hypothetical protein
MSTGTPVGSSPAKLWEIRYTGCSEWHKVPFGGLERFLLSSGKKVSEVQEIRISVLE